ncbi:MAG: FAD-dependent oxidoreductase [Bdellovibrionota bacterium]
MNRRDLLKTTAAGFVLSQFPSPLSNWAHAQSITDSSPLAKISGPFATAKFNGDNEDIPHDLLWNRDGFLSRMGGIPRATESCDLIVIGGGIAGLAAAYEARGRDIVILEQADRFGGNAKGERFAKSAYSMGAAYMCPPDEGDPLEVLLKDLGLDKAIRTETGAPVFMNGTYLDDVFQAGVTAKAKADLARVQVKLRDIFENSFPEIPLAADAAEAKAVKALDQLTFEAWLQEEFGALDPLVLEFIQLYCWSSFNGSIDELSAAQALNFLAAEVDGVMALPGGNAAVTDALYRRLAKDPTVSLRASSFVVDVDVRGDRVLVCTFENKKLRTIEAKHAIFAAPKFLLEKVMPLAPQALLKAASEITYRAYLVANVSLKKPAPADHYDVFCLEGTVPPAPAAMRQSDRAFTDFISGDWATSASTSESLILTVYRPLPFDGARQFLFHPGAHDKHRDIVLEGLEPVLKPWGLTRQDIEGIRMSRWGHAVPVAQKGFASSVHPMVFETGIGGRLFFAGQDIWANPAIETALETAKRAVSQI